MKGCVKISEWGADLDAKIDEIIKNNPPERQPWTDKEIYVLRKMWGRTAAKNITKIIPARNLRGIKLKAKELGLKRLNNSWGTQD